MSISQPSVKTNLQAGESKTLSILVPTDFSEAARNAFDYALHIADNLSAKITLLFVYQESHVASGYLPSDLVEKMKKETIELATRLFSEYKESAQQKWGDSIQMDTKLLCGRPASELVQYSQELEADIIIMGTKGAASPAERILGSIAAEVLRRAGCPVWVIPAETDYQPVQNIMYATDLKSNDYGVMEQVYELAQNLGAKLICAHIAENSNWENESDQELVRSLLEWEKTGEIELRVVKGDDPFHGLTMLVNDYKVDVLAMLTHDRYVLSHLDDPSITRKMALYTDTPLLAFHQTTRQRA